MNSASQRVVWAEDDTADQALFRRAMFKAKVAMSPHFVGDGLELIHYLKNEGDYTDREQAPRPGLILLDLNMPGIDGRSVLKYLSNDHDLRRIPVVVISTSSEESEIVNSYDLGANSFVTKPDDFEELVNTVRVIDNYWTGVCQVPVA